MNACAPAVWLLVMYTRITQYRARAVAVLSMEWVFGDTFQPTGFVHATFFMFNLNIIEL